MHCETTVFHKPMRYAIKRVYCYMHFNLGILPFPHWSHDKSKWLILSGLKILWFWIAQNYNLITVELVIVECISYWV